VKYNKNNLYLFIPFFSALRTGQTRGWIFMRDSSKDVKSRKNVPFWGYILKFNVKPIFIKKRVKFGPKRNTFFDRKRLTMGVLKKKLPFVIVAP